MISCYPCQRRMTEGSQVSTEASGLQDEWESSHHSKRMEIYNKMAAIKSLIHDVEVELLKEAAEKNSGKQIDENKAFVEELKEKVKSLEDEIEKLIQENLIKLRREKEERKFSTPTKFQAASMRQNKKKTDSKSGAQIPDPSKSKKTIKCVTRKTSPGSNVRKITMIRARVPVSKSKFSSEEKLSKGGKKKASYKHSESSSPDLVSSSSPNPAPKNKNHVTDKTDRPKISTCEGCQMKPVHQQPKGDCECNSETKEWHADSKNKKQESKSKFTIRKGKNCNDENDIFKSVLRTRKQLVEEAKRRHLFQ